MSLCCVGGVSGFSLFSLIWGGVGGWGLTNTTSILIYLLTGQRRPRPSKMRKMPFFFQLKIRRKRGNFLRALQCVLVSGDSEEILAASGPLSRAPSTALPPLQQGRVVRGLRERRNGPSLLFQDGQEGSDYDRDAEDPEREGAGADAARPVSKGKGGFLTSTVGGEPPGEDVYKFENMWHPSSGHYAGRGIFALLCCVCCSRAF
jgi:hypothetical protein